MNFCVSFPDLWTQTSSFHPLTLKIQGGSFLARADSKFCSSCCIFHSLIPPNASLPTLIHLCQPLNPAQSDTRACGCEQVRGIWDGGTHGPLGAADFQMWHAYEWSPKYWALGVETVENPHLFTGWLLSSMDYGSIFSHPLFLRLSLRFVTILHSVSS